MDAAVRRDQGAAPESDEWNSHWAEFGGANERNPAQDYRRRLAARLLLERAAPPARLLDVGSGNGEFLALASIRWPGAELLGLELSESAVAEASRKVPAARFRAFDLLRDPVPEDGRRWATHAICSEVLEHVDDPVALLRNARNWFAPGCRVVITVPGGPMSAFDKHIGHRRHFTPADLSEVIGAAGMELLHAGGAGFPFFKVYRALVIARGQRLIADARSGGANTPAGLVTRAGMAAFRPLFLLNIPRSRFGWQTVGVAREPS